MSIWKNLFGSNDMEPSAEALARLDKAAIKSGAVSDSHPGRAEQIERDCESAERYWKEVRQHMRDNHQDPDLQ